MGAGLWAKRRQICRRQNSTPGGIAQTGVFMEDSFFVKYSILAFPACLSSYAVFLLITGLAAVIKNKPLIIEAVPALLSFAPLLIYGIITAAVFKGTFPVVVTILYSLTIIVMIVSLFLTRSYSIFYARDSDIRDAVMYALHNNSVEFEERIHTFHLITLHNELKLSLPSMMEFTGNGAITIKHKKDRVLFKKIINDTKAYIRGNAIQSNKKAVVFDLLCSVVLILISVFLGIFLMQSYQDPSLLF
jgi:hypothetical protein